MPDSPIKSTEVYRILRRTMKRWAETSGFQPHKNGALWSKDLGPRGTLFFWFQCNKFGWQPYGGEFTLEFELSNRGAPHGPDMNSRERFSWLLEPKRDFGVLLAQQNAVIRKLPPPGPDPIGIGDEQWAENFQPISCVNQNFWMRYYERVDIELWWTEFLCPRFERMMERFLEGDPLAPGFTTHEAREVSLRMASRSWLLLVPQTGADPLRLALEELNPTGPAAFILHARTGEHLFELGEAPEITTHRSPAGTAHRIKCKVTQAGRHELIAALKGPPTQEPRSSDAFGALKLWILAPASSAAVPPA